MIGKIVKFNLAPPIYMKSAIFIASSIDIIEIKDIPKADLSAKLKVISFNKIIVSRIIEVIKPLNIARIIIFRVGKSISKNWKKPIVPKSPIEHPNKHQRVLTLDLDQVCLQSHQTPKK